VDRTLLEGGNGPAFELSLKGWGKSNPAHVHQADDWIDVSIRVSSSTGDWSDDGELLMADEAKWLANWLEAIALRRNYNLQIEFAEPDFSFRIVEESEDTVLIRVYFEHRGRPPWARADLAEDRDIWIDLNLHRRDLEDAAASVRSELASIEGI
jgi:hypothetical protein